MATITNTTKRIPAVRITAVDGVTLVDRTISIPANLSLAFADGTLTAFDVAGLSPEILSQALVHGLRQKLADAAAISRNVDTGASATTADKKAAVLEVAERLAGGEWNKTARETSGSTMLAEALARMKGCDVADMVAFLSDKSDEQKAALTKNARVAATILAIKAERAAKRAEGSDIDTDSMLDDLGLGE